MKQKPVKNARMEELRRRVLTASASIASAQLAERYRRAGCHEDAIEAPAAPLLKLQPFLGAIPVHRQRKAV